MGRGGSNALARWITSQYPSEANVQYFSDSGSWKVQTFYEFFKPTPNAFQVYRQECVMLQRFREIASETNTPMDSFPDKCVAYAWRDPWNHLSSLLRFWFLRILKENDGVLDENEWARKIREVKNTFIPNHKRILRQALGLEKFLPDNSVFINYNRWFSEAEYRAQIAEQLRLPTSEIGVDTIWNRSSFDAIKETGAQSLGVLERWKEYYEVPYYMDYFQDRELVELSAHFWKPPFLVTS